MLMLTECDVESILTLDQCITVVESAYAELARGNAVNFPRVNLLAETTPPGADEDNAESRVYGFKTIGGLMPGLGIAVLRIISEVVAYPVVNGQKRKRKLPAARGSRYCGTLLCFSTRTGDPLAIMPDGPVSNLLPAARGAVGTKYLARRDASVLAVIGAGEQAKQAVLAATRVRPLGRVLVYSPSSRERFAQELHGLTGIAAEAVESPEAAVTNADIVISATNGQRPVVKGSWLRPGTHLNAINPKDVGPDCVERADLVVKTWKSDAPRYQEHVVPSMEGRIPMEYAGFRVAGDNSIALGDILIGKHPGRTSDGQVTFHDNVSAGMQFAAVVDCILRVAKAKGLGQELPDAAFLHSYH